MRITVKYYNIVADYLKCNEENLELAEGANCNDLLLEISRLKPVFHTFIYAHGDISNTSLRIFRNQQLVYDLQQALTDGDDVLIFPAISGGDS